MGDHESWGGIAVATSNETVRDNIACGNRVRCGSPRGGERRARNNGKAGGKQPGKSVCLCCKTWYCIVAALVAFSPSISMREQTIQATLASNYKYSFERAFLTSKTVGEQYLAYFGALRWTLCREYECMKYSL